MRAATSAATHATASLPIRTATSAETVPVTCLRAAAYSTRNASSVRCHRAAKIGRGGIFEVGTDFHQEIVFDPPDGLQILLDHGLEEVGQLRPGKNLLLELLVQEVLVSVTAADRALEERPFATKREGFLRKGTCTFCRAVKNASMRSQALPTAS